MMILKQSTASQSVLLGPFVDDTDGATAETGLTIANTDIRLSANGGNMFAKTSGGGTHDENGWYTITLDATDTATVGRLQVSCKVAGALAVFMEFQIVEEDTYEFFYASGAAPDAQIAALPTTAEVNAEVDTALSDFWTSPATLVDLIWDEVLTGATHNEPDSAGKRLRQIDAAFEVLSGTATAGTANTITFESGADAVNDDIYRGDRVVIVAGTGAGEHGLIVSYNASTLVATVSENWVVTPSTDSEYIVVPADVDVETWQHNVVSASAGGLPDVNVNEVGDTAQTAGDLAALIATADSAIDAVATTIGAAGAGLTEAGGDGDHLTESGGTGDQLTALATAASLATAQTDLDTISDGIITGTAATGTLSTTSCTSSLTGYTDDQLIGRIITFLAGPADGESSDITDYAETNGQLTFTALTLAPENGNAFKIT